MQQHGLHLSILCLRRSVLLLLSCHLKKWTIKSIKTIPFLAFLVLIASLVYLKEFFASVAERASKPDNNTPQHQHQNRTRTPAENCFDLGEFSTCVHSPSHQQVTWNEIFNVENLTLQENTRFCWPVRPIPRRNFLHEDMNDPHNTTGQNSSGTNAAIGE